MVLSGKLFDDFVALNKLILFIFRNERVTKKDYYPEGFWIIFGRKLAAVTTS